MRRVKLGSILLFFQVILGAGFGFSQDSEAYKSCSSKATTTPEIHQCANAEAVRVDAELNKIYTHLLTVIKADPIATKKVKAAQRAWIAYRDSFVEAMFSDETKQNYGSSYGIEVLRLNIELTHTQIDRLKELIRFHSED